LAPEADGVTANADHLLGLFVNQGFDEADGNRAHLLQGGLGLPDRDAYLDASPEAAARRAKYQGHLDAVLRLAGQGQQAEARAARVLALEVAIARSHAPDADAAEVTKQDNPWRRADFAAKAPGLDWDAWFAAAGLAAQPVVIVWQPSAVTGLAALAASEDLGVWRDYLRVHLIDHDAAVLPAAVAAEHATAFGAAPPRDVAALAATQGALGQAVGQLYVSQYFRPEAKAAARAMVDGVVAAWRGRLAHAPWMSPMARRAALAKLAALQVGLGYPETWIDYAGLEVVRGDALGNLRRAEAFSRARNLARLGRPIDPIDGPLDPQTVGAVILFSPNAEMFSAGLLQPPYFDPGGDAAANYGSAGAGLAHEIGHSFDELGHIYDAQGRLRDWWTPADLEAHHAISARVAAQFDRACPRPDLCVKGAQVSSETMGDLGGLLAAHDAYLASLHGRRDKVIGGLTGEQRFFVAFAQRWRKLQTEDALRRQVAGDTHVPPQVRANAVRNVEAWYRAFGVKPGDGLYLKPQDRVGLW
ncbi:MAG TPA: M13 family metallopeptidase, partial [Phenylobacterium sp.]